MLTPGFGEAEVSLSRGILGWDKSVFYNPSFLMLQVHRTFASISYGGFFMAGWCGIRLYLTRDTRKKEYYEDNGRLAYFIAFAALLALPIIGYFYSYVLMKEANEAFWNLMLGRGHVVIGGVDLWWLKHYLVVAMVGGSLSFFQSIERGRSKAPFTIPAVMVYAVAGFYLMFYLAMGMIMTWTFFWMMLVAAVGAALLFRHLVKYHRGSGRAVFLLMGIFSFLTVLLGGYIREASRPRFVDRISHYDNVYVPEERQPYLMLDVRPEDIVQAPAAEATILGAAQLINERCIGCHTIARVKNYQKDDWERVMRLMVTYGAKLNAEEAELVIEHLQEGLLY